jgi:hypothetical protein
VKTKRKQGEREVVVALRVLEKCRCDPVEEVPKGDEEIGSCPRHTTAKEKRRGAKRALSQHLRKINS